MVQHTDRVYLDEPLLSVMVLSSRIAYGKSASSGMTGSSALSAKVPCPISRLLGAPILPTSPTQDGGNVYCSIAIYTLQSTHLPHVQCYQALYKWHSFLFAGGDNHTHHVVKHSKHHLKDSVKTITMYTVHSMQITKVQDASIKLLTWR